MGYSTVSRAPPILVTENGCAYDDTVVEGRVRDERRIDSCSVT
jgi:beta-glucosidase/6-phospho-beta-glucosidase/beta-galactosidase